MRVAGSAWQGMCAEGDGGGIHVCHGFPAQSCSKILQLLDSQFFLLNSEPEDS